MPPIALFTLQQRLKNFYYIDIDMPITVSHKTGVIPFHSTFWRTKVMYPGVAFKILKLPLYHVPFLIKPMGRLRSVMLLLLLYCQFDTDSHSLSPRAISGSFGRAPFLRTPAHSFEPARPGPGIEPGTVSGGLGLA